MEFVSLNPRPLYILSFVVFLMFIQLKIIDVIHLQQAPPSLPFASPLAKPNLANLVLRT
jgi:hypothetical protein